MPRQPRHIVPGGVYHLISRFVDREWFIQTANERAHYLSLMARALAESDWRCLAYAVMSNHLHLSSVAGKQTLSSWVRRVHSPFAGSMNRAYDRIGSMFARGPKAFVVPPEKLGAVLAYIHNNPVRAGVVREPGASDWTSHRAYIGAVAPPRWLHVAEGLERAHTSAVDFDSMVRTGHVESTRTEWEVFDDLQLEEAIDPGECPLAVDPSELVRVVADVVGLSPDAIRSRRRQADHVLARHVVARCGDELGLSGVAIARAVGASQQSISKILTQSSARNGERELVECVMRRLGDGSDRCRGAGSGEVVSDP